MKADQQLVRTVDVFDRAVNVVGSKPQEIISAKGLAQVSDEGAVEREVDEVLTKNAPEVERYRAGKKQVYGFLVGQVMKAMAGKANPAW